MVELLNSVFVNMEENSLDKINTLQQYLRANVDFLPSEKTPFMPDEPQFTRVKITVTNSATAGSIPEIVFASVGLGVAKIGGDSGGVSPEQINFKMSRIKPPKSENEHFRHLQKVNYVRMNGVEFMESSPDENEHGEFLFPGESIIFDMDILNDELPYFQFRLDGTISSRHLLHSATVLPVAEAYTKPIIVKALLSFNSLDIHQPLNSILISIPEFDNDTTLSEIRKCMGVLSAEEENVNLMQKAVNDLYRHHKFSVFQAHMQQAYDYFDHIKEATRNLREAISSSITERIAAEVEKIQDLNAEANQINSETEELMSNYHLSDEEVSYKYRSLA